MQRIESIDTPADRLVQGLPRDQALGLRLLALARTAAAVHLAQTAQAHDPSENVSTPPRAEAHR